MKNPSSPSNSKALILLALQFLSDFGNQIAHALLALCLLDITQSTTKVGAVYLITTIGYVVFTFAGGALGDMLSRRKLLFSTDMGRGVIALLMILAVHQKSIVLIYATSFLLSILDSLHRPVKFSVWAESIPSKHLERYNSLSELSIQGSSVFGPLIASFFILMSWRDLGFAFNALTFFICAVAFVRIISDKNSTEKPTSNGLGGFMKGFGLIAKQPEISRYVAYDAIQMIGFGAFNATFLVLAQRDFGWSKIEYSYHLSIVAVCTVLGALLGATGYIGQFNQRLRLIFCALTSATAMWAVLQIQSFPIASVLVGICDGLAVLTMAVTRTKVQLFAKNCHPEYLSSIQASRGLVIKAATLLGTGACLLIDDFISLQATLMLFVIPIGLSAVPFMTPGSKALRPAEAPAPIKVDDQ